MDYKQYKFVVIRRVHNVLIRFDTERGRTGPGNYKKKVPGVLCSLRVSFVRFVLAFTGLILHN